MRIHIAIAVLLVAVASPARAQQADSRWTAWLGCWQMLDERVREGNPSGADAVAAAGERALGNATNITVCVAPASQPGGVTLTTRASGESALEQTIIADAIAHPVSEADCQGSQRAEWSGDGRRLFARAELTCANQPVRTISGLAMIRPDGTWLDVQAIEIGGRTNVRVRRYRRSAVTGRAEVGSAAALAHAVADASRALTVDNVKEASTKVAPAVLEAALIESRARFNLTRNALIDLDDANVPDAVIDLMVALSYPDKFQVERRLEQSLDLYPPSFAGADWNGYVGFGYPYLSWYPEYYGNYRYYYSPFGYAYSGLYGPYSPYYGGSSSVGGGTATPPSADTGDGRAVNGIGYTRIRPRDAVPAESSGGSSSGSSSGGRSTVSSGGGYSQSGGGSSSSSGGGSSSSGGGSSSSGGGASGGSSGGSDGGGRTAQPR